ARRVAAADELEEDRPFGTARLLAVHLGRVELDALTREELSREASLLGGHDDEADRCVGEAAQPLDHARVKAVAREPAGLVPRDPLVTHAVELAPDGLGHAPEVGEPRVGAPVPR